MHTARAAPQYLLLSDVVPHGKEIREKDAEMSLESITSM